MKDPSPYDGIRFQVDSWRQRPGDPSGAEPPDPGGPCPGCQAERGRWQRLFGWDGCQACGARYCGACWEASRVVTKQTLLWVIPWDKTEYVCGSCGCRNRFPGE